MNDALAREMRAAAREALPEGAFLRRARGEGLYVTDAPRRCPIWRAADLEAAGFVCREQGGLMTLSPGARWLEAAEAALPLPADFFTESLRRFQGLPAGDEALRLFARGARLLDGERGDFAAFDRQLRQYAARALRGAPAGGLFACAALHWMLMDNLPTHPTDPREEA